MFAKSQFANLCSIETLDGGAARGRGQLSGENFLFDLV